MVQFIIRGMAKVNRDIQKLVNDTPKLAENIRRKMGKRTKQLAKGYVIPKWGSKGTLKNSIIMRKEGIDATLITAEAPYAEFVELGTTAHKIAFAPGSKGDLLSRFWRTERGKAWHVAGSSRLHPGSKAMGFMQQAYAQINREAEGIILEETNKYVERRS